MLRGGGSEGTGGEGFNLSLDGSLLLEELLKLLLLTATDRGIDA